MDTNNLLYTEKDLEIFNNKKLATRLLDDEKKFYDMTYQDKVKLLKELGYDDAEVSKFINEVEQYKTGQNYNLTKKYKESAINVLQQQLIDFKITKNREIIFVLGLPGAGKSTIINKIKEIYKEKEFYCVDSDIFKTGLRDLNNNQLTKPLQNPDLCGIDVEFIHKATAEMAAIFLDYLTFNGYDVITPKIGDNITSLNNLINKFKDRNYKIYIHFVYCSINTSLSRNLLRFKKDKKEERRLVPVKMIFDIGYKPLYNFLILLNKNICDEYYLRDGTFNYDQDAVLFKKSKTFNNF